MAPVPLSTTPRIVIYHQTHHDPTDRPISILPLLTPPLPSLTNLIIAAVHLNDPPGNITLNDHSPFHPRNETLWSEVNTMQASGIKVSLMLGGAAKGSFTRLDLDDDTFELFYRPLRDLVRAKKVDGIDLDVEEPMTLPGIVRLIDRLRGDFGEEFLITLAPVASALWGEEHLSGFDYETLEAMRGQDIAWYNTHTDDYRRIIARGWDAQKVVFGMVTSPNNGTGWVSNEIIQEVLLNFKLRYGNAFGGVMGWEYFNSKPGDVERPWEWARFMHLNIREDLMPAKPAVKSTTRDNQRPG